MKGSKSILSILNALLTIAVVCIANMIVVEDFDDNESYNLAFKSVEGLGITEAYLLFSSIIGGGIEPIYFLINYIFSFLDFNILILLINIVFLYSFYRLLKRFYSNNYQIIYSVSLISSNLILVLLSDVHRLKVAYLFFMAYLTSFKYKNLFLVTSLLSHFQMIGFIIYTVVNNIFNRIFFRRKIKISKLRLLLFLLAIGAIIFIYYDSIYSYIYLPLGNKLSYYIRALDNFAYFNIARFGGMFGIYITYLIIFRLKETLHFILPIFFTLFFLSIILNLYRLNLVWLFIIFLVEMNRLLLGKKFAILIVAPLFIYNLFYTSEFIWRALSL